MFCRFSRFLFIPRYRNLACSAGIVAILFLFTTTSLAVAQCTKWIADSLDPSILGADGPVYALAVWDPDGAGPAAPQLVFGGNFDSAGGIVAHDIAAWDGLVWRSFGDGMDSTVVALTVYNGQLIAGGRFTQADGVNTGHVAAWNGTSWQQLGQLFGQNTGDDDVRALGVWNGQLIAAGTFSDPQNDIASWDGTVWHNLSSGISGDVYCIFSDAPERLYVGGYTGSAGGVPTQWFASWDGTNWYACPHYGDYTAPREPVNSITVHEGDLCIATRGWVERLVNSDWSSFPELTTDLDIIAVLTHYNGQLLAAGGFIAPGLRVAAWNGSAWQSLGAGIGFPQHDNSYQTIVWALCAYQGALFAGGSFDQNGNGSPAPNFTRWDGQSWASPHVTQRVNALATYGGKVAVGGNFSQPTSAGQAYHILSWDGANFAKLGSGLDAPASALVGYATQTPITTTHLAVGGSFTHAGGTTVNRVAQWTESPTYPFNSWSAMGDGFNNAVLALEDYRGQVVAGGTFTASGTTATSRVARWNGTSWDPMSLGMNGNVRALKAFYVNSVKNYILVAGGDFTTAEGTSANRIAYWTENSLFATVTPWQPMGDGFNGSVNAVERYNGATYAAGAFTASGSTPLNHIAKYTTSGWVEVGGSLGGGVNGTVWALKADGGYLYAAGDFTLADGAYAYNVARWDGVDWSDAGGGTSGTVFALAAFNGEMLAGGEITQAGSEQTIGLARFLSTGTPWLYSQPGSQTLTPGGDANFSVTPASGYDGLSYEWRKDAVPLSDGMTPQGSVIAGSHTANLVVQNVAVTDSGAYDCVVTNTCGNVTSASGQLTVNGTTAVPAGGVGGLSLAVWPTPTNGSTHVEFRLPKDAEASLTVYDVRGRAVRELARGDYPSSLQVLSWDGRDGNEKRVPAGVYFLRLRAGGALVTRRVTVLK